jgi:hypothetical protein
MPWYSLNPYHYRLYGQKEASLEDVAKAERPSTEGSFSNSNLLTEPDVSLVASSCGYRCVPSVGARKFHVSVTPRSETADGTPSRG